jgi:hypothetical protein
MVVRAQMPMPAVMFPHGEQVHVKFPREFYVRCSIKESV